MKAPGKPNSLIKTGAWWFDPEFGRFINALGKEVFLESRLKKIFVLLLENKNLIIKRQEIIDSVWKEVTVNEESLTKGIFDLRNFLKNNGLNHVKIETIRNIGYRLTLKEDDENPPIPKNKIGQRILQVSLYAIGAIAVIIILIRAIRY